MIASVSFGASRDFDLRLNADHARKVRFPLGAAGMRRSDESGPTTYLACSRTAYHTCAYFVSAMQTLP